MTLDEADAYIAARFPDEDENADKLYGLTLLDFLMERPFQAVLKPEARIQLAAELKADADKRKKKARAGGSIIPTYDVPADVVPFPTGKQPA